MKFMNIVKNKFFISGVVVIVAIVAYLSFSSKNNSSFQTAAAYKGDIVQEVSATGNVSPVQNADLGFAKVGRINGIAIAVGDHVSAGEILANLDNNDLKAQLEQAQATLENQQAKLDQLKAGTRPEEIQIKESQLAQAQQALNNYYSGTPNILNDAFSKANDALRNQTAGIFINGSTLNPQLTFSTKDQQPANNVINSLITINSKFDAWQTEVANLQNNSSPADIDSAIADSEKSLSNIRDFLNDALVALNDSIGLSPTNLSGYKTAVNTGLTNVNAAASEVNNQAQSISAQKLAVQTAQNELDLDKAGSTPQDIAAQEALVRQAQADIDNYEAQIENTYIRAPFDGLVTQVNSKIGEISSLSAPVISLISDSKFEIDADIPETDIAAVSVGEPADVTLDAYGSNVIFKAKVVSIDPAETIVEGVTTYKTTLQFLNNEDKIKSGMTANIDIKTAEHKNAIIIPQRAVISDSGEKTVEILNVDGKSFRTVQVKTGLRSTDGNIEILSGVNEGDKVIIPQ